MDTMEFKGHGRIKTAAYATVVLAVAICVGWNVATPLASCRTEESVPTTAYINGDDVQISSRRGITTLNDEIANGVLFFLNANGDTIKTTQYRHGKENGESRTWYDNGMLCEVRIFADGRKEGTHFGWYSNGAPRFIYHFEKDIYEGEYIEWYSNGQKFRSQNFVAGHENGRQQIWFQGGQIKSNYIIKNDKRYGLFGTENCVNVADSVSR